MSIPRALLPILVLFAVPATATSLFRQLYDLDDLPLLKTGVHTYQVSSHDPTGGNADAGHYVRLSGNIKTLADLKGPGIVRRIWSANPSGRIKINVDGATVTDAPFADLFEDRVPGFAPPLASRSSGGWFSYVPIAFRKSCVITAADADDFYYQVTWQQLPSAEGLIPFHGEPSSEDEAAYRNAITAWSGLGEQPSSSKSVNLPKRFISLPPGGRWAQPIHGPGTITALRFSFPNRTSFPSLRRVILRISFDGEKSAVEAPLGDFLGMGFDGVQWKSLPLGGNPMEGYCYFRMPFKTVARIEIENQDKASFQAAFSGTARSGVPAASWGYFHANYHSAINAAGKDYVAGQLRGKGHVVGITESMRGIGSQWFLEGDEKVYVDGGRQPAIYGTGTEDFYNCGWYFNTGLVDTALHGLSHKTSNEIGAWRFLIPDSIAFSNALDFHMEHGGTNDVPGSEYSSVLYWYGAHGARFVDHALPRGSALLPRPYLPPIEGALQATDANWFVSGHGTVRKQGWQELAAYRGAGRVILKGRAGASASFGIDTRFSDDYDVDVYVSGTGTNSRASLILDGKPIGSSVVDSPGPLPARKIAVGPIRIMEGRHAFGLRLDSGSSIAITAIRINPRSPLVRDFAVLGPFPADAGVKTSLPPDGVYPDLTQGYVVNGETLKWKVLRTSGGFLDLTTTLSQEQNAVAYVAFAVKSPKDQTLPLMVGSDDGVQVWANGKTLWTNHAARGFTLDQDRIPVALRTGWNTVVLKVEQSSGEWCVSARFPDVDNTLRYAAVVPSGS